MAMFFTGANVFLGKTGEGLDPGFRLGTILGGRLNPQVSINGELTLDFLNPSNVPAGVDTSAAEIDFSFSPLLHVPAGGIELVVGPKLGFWGGGATQTFAGQTTSFRFGGVLAGLNGGLFFSLSPTTQIGGLLSLTVRKYNNNCSTQPGQSEVCDPDNLLPDADKVLGITGALLF
jgi:hypothetical protein